MPAGGVPHDGITGPAGGRPGHVGDLPAVGGQGPASGFPAGGIPAGGNPDLTPGSPGHAPGMTGPAGPAPGPAGPTPDPISGTPYPGTPFPTSGANPYGGTPTSAQPYGPFQTSGAPYPPAPEEQEGWTQTPYGFAAAPGRRIEPSPPPERNRLVLGILAGLLAGLVLFGTGGYFAGRATAPAADPGRTSAPTAPAPTPSGQLGVFEQNQVAINRTDFAGTGLTAFAEGWLPHLSTCTRNGTPGGPKLNVGEKFRVRCTLDGMSAIFVEYKSAADRDKARVKALGQAVDARTLTPGVGPAVERTSPSGRTTGNYLEYAYRLTESGTTRTVSGIWWDDAQTPVAGYLLAYWKEGVGEKWEPMRDLWSRYA